MAEAVAILVIGKIAEILGSEVLKQGGSLLFQKGSELKRIRSKFQNIQRELEIMQAFLRDAEKGMEVGEEEEEKNSALGAWLGQVRGCAYEVEDIIDELTYLFDEQQQQQHGFRGFLRKAVNHTKKLRSWLDIPDKLQETESRLTQLSTMKERYGIKITGEGTTSDDQYSERWKRLAESSHFIGKDFMEIKDYKARLIQWLTDDDDDDDRLKMISVWGMGGLGKTTLVTNVYKSPTVRERFNCYAWISVSQTYKVEDLLRRIIKEFMEEKEKETKEKETKERILPDIHDMSHRRLVETLHDYLQDKRYILILDDVWSTNLWKEVKDALIDKNRASRIVLTTRNQDVAMLAAKNYIMELSHLEKGDAWELFCRKAFGLYSSEACPPELKYWAQKIVDKCQGLPLALATIGSMLSLKDQSESEWKKVFDRLSWELAHNPALEDVKRILIPSLKDLPHCLKNCFLYCSMFPEDYGIKRNRIIRLWMAEGFIENRGTNQTMEESAGDILNQLVCRSMLQVVERNEFGRVKVCRMHDILREMTISISRREKFGIAYDNPAGTSLEDQARRLSINNSSNGIIQSCQRKKMFPLRSFLWFDYTTDSLILSSMCSSWRLLKVLHLDGAPISSVPDQVFDLFNLRYLCLRETQVKELPGSVERLHNLETLDLLNVNISPLVITKLINLRHLIADIVADPTYRSMHNRAGTPAPKGIWDLRHLQTLRSMEADVQLISQLGKMTQLRSLEITEVELGHCEDLSTAIKKMNGLHKLYITAKMDYNESGALDLSALYQTPLLNLQKLALDGKLEGSVLPWLACLSKLTHLSLHDSGLKEEEDLLNSLVGLPHLAVLELYRAHETQHLIFRAGWFPRLKRLGLVVMERLQRVEIHQGALVSLELLRLSNCWMMEELPQGWEHLTALQELGTRKMPKEFEQRLSEKREHFPFNVNKM